MADESAPIQSSRWFRISALSTGKLSVVVTGIFAIIAIIRCKREDIPKVVDAVVSSHLFCILGWILAVVILLGAVIFIKLLISFYEKGIQRLAKERDDLQTKLLKK